MSSSADSSFYQVVVYGGTSAGITAAILAARRGHSVILIEPSRHLGGMTTGGLGMTDHGRAQTVGGLSREFYRRIRHHYENDGAGRPEEAQPAAPDPMWCFEPRVAHKIFAEMLLQDRVPVVLEERLDLRLGSVHKQGSRIQSIRMESGRLFQGRIFIDATYEGDLLARAGVTYCVGRESNEAYGEALNGVQASRATEHQFEAPVDPYVQPSNPASGLLPGIDPSPLAPDGTGDARLQAFCYRLCLTDYPPNRVPFRKPDDYDPLNYELLLRSLVAGANQQSWMRRTSLPFTQCAMPNRKTDSNNSGPVSFDYIGMNHGYPEAGYGEREVIAAAHRNYQMGLLWFLAHDQRVPRATRAAMAGWGLPADEFAESGNWPPQLYVREARRMRSDYVMTEHDCLRRQVASDSIGMGSYTMDSHHVRRYVTADGEVRNEGDVQVDPGGAYAISYRSIVPQRRECTNLLVPVCISAAHIAFGSIRMESVFMILGHSAATAASIALSLDLDVQEVPYSALREELLREEQCLDLSAGAENESQPLNPVSAAR